MCMGFGCNAAGVVGCRIIDSPRERLHRHPHQQLRPLQRPLSHAHRHHHHVLCGYRRRIGRLTAVRPAAHRADRCWGVGLTFAGLPAAVRKPCSRGCPPPLPWSCRPTDRPRSARSSSARSWTAPSLCWAGRWRWRRRRGCCMWVMANVTVGGHEPAGPLRRASWTRCAQLMGYGRGDSDGLHSGLSRQRDRAAHRHHGLSGTAAAWWPWTI